MKILTTRTPLSRMPFLFEDLGLEMITASLRTAGFSCRYLDALQENIDPTQYISRLSNGPEDVLCVTIHAEAQADEIMSMLSAVKRQAPDKIVVVGGHPTHAIDELIFKVYPDGFDYIVRGDGEDAIVELLTHLTSGALALDAIGGLSYKTPTGLARVPNRRRNRDYDRVPRAARDTWEGKHPRPRTDSALIHLSRGCNHVCQFCSVVTLYGIEERWWASRSIESFTQEVAELNAKYGIRDFTIVDPNFLGNPQTGNTHVRDLIGALAASGLEVIYDVAARVDAFSEPLIDDMYESGLRRVFIGIESGVQSTLKGWRKAVTAKQNVETATRLAARGVYIDTGFIMLTPMTTLAEIGHNLAFLRTLPYFTPRALNSVLWPIHEVATTTTIDGEFLLADDSRISLGLQFAHRAVDHYHALIGGMRRAFSEPHLRMYWHMWDRMYDDPDVIRRFGIAMHEMLDVELEIAERVLERLQRGLSFAKVEDAAWRWIDESAPHLAAVAESFSAASGSPPRGVEATLLENDRVRKVFRDVVDD